MTRRNRPNARGKASEGQSHNACSDVSSRSQRDHIQLVVARRGPLGEDGEIARVLVLLQPLPDIRRPGVRAVRLEDRIHAIGELKALTDFRARTDRNDGHG